MKKFLIALLFPLVAHAQSGVSASYIHMTPTILPSACRAGDIRIDSTAFLLQVCYPAGTWTTSFSSAPTTVGALGGGSTSNNGSSIVANVLYEQSASATKPGLVNTTTQTFAGVKTLTSPVLITPALGTPASGVMTNVTGTAAGLTAGNATTAVNLAGGLGGQIPYQTAAGATGFVANGTSGQVLTSGGTTLPYTWSSPFTNPMTTLGDTVYGGASGASTRLAGDTSNTKKFMSETSSSGVATAPVWAVLVSGDIPNNAANTSGTAATFTGSLTGDITSTAMATTYNNTVPINKGGTNVTSVTIAPTASAWAGWDTNSNLSAFNLIDGYATTATAAGTTTLTVASKYQQYFTGSTTQTVLMPVVTTLVNGQQFAITNVSSGTVTVQSSGANSIQAMAQNTQLILTVKDTTAGTGTASWVWTYSAINNSSVAGGGTVTSVTFTGDGTVLSNSASSAVTTSGTVTATLATQTARTFLAGPQSGSAAAPTFKALTAATSQPFTSTGSTTAYYFTVSSATVGSGCVFTNNSKTFTTVGSTTSSTQLWATGTGAPATSGTLTYSSGGSGCNGAANLTFSATQTAATYTLPTNPSPLYLIVTAVGGGGGGGGSGGSGGTGTAGGVTAFGPNLITVSGGQGGALNNGGTAGGGNIGSFSGDFWPGAVGGTGGQTSVSTVYAIGGIGASSCFGGAGTNGGPVDAGGAALANTGAGGGGAGCTSTSSTCNAGGGGGSGGCAKDIIIPVSSLPATIYYTVAGSGSGGSAGTSPTGELGGAGATGYLRVRELYQ